VWVLNRVVSEPNEVNPNSCRQVLSSAMRRKGREERGRSGEGIRRVERGRQQRDW